MNMKIFKETHKILYIRGVTMSWQNYLFVVLLDYLQFNIKSITFIRTVKYSVLIKVPANFVIILLVGAI